MTLIPKSMVKDRMCVCVKAFYFFILFNLLLFFFLNGDKRLSLWCELVAASLVELIATSLVS